MEKDQTEQTSQNRTGQTIYEDVNATQPATFETENTVIVPESEEEQKQESHQHPLLNLHETSEQEQRDWLVSNDTKHEAHQEQHDNMGFVNQAKTITIILSKSTAKSFRFGRNSFIAILFSVLLNLDSLLLLGSYYPVYKATCEYIKGNQGNTTIFVIFAVVALVAGVRMPKGSWRIFLDKPVPEMKKLARQRWKDFKTTLEG